MDSIKHLFEPIAHESVADEVVEQIENLIISGVLKEGCKLPSEREMAELFSVSRPKLREALKRLEEEQLVETRHGDGTFVAPLIGKALSPALVDLYSRHPVAFFDYLEYRREQESFAARLAAERATEADKEIIRRILDKVQAAHDSGDIDAEKDADIDFHTAVVDASHNATLSHMMSSIYDLTKRGLFYNRSYLRTIDGTGDALLQQHLDIGEAILNGDPEKAALAARAHMDFVETSFRAGDANGKREKFAKKRLLLHEASGHF